MTPPAAPSDPLASTSFVELPRLRRVHLMPRRIEVWATPGERGTAAARVLYRARRRARVAGTAVARALPIPGTRPLSAPLAQTVATDIARDMGLHPDAAAALHVRETQRWLFALTLPDESGIVVKLGMVDDEGLAREAATMTQLAASDSALQIPTVRWYGRHKGWFALVTDIVARKNTSAESNLEDARTIACALATSKRGFVVHGDLAPWNILPTDSGLVLVDWEDGRFEEDPLFDLAHYVIRSGALLRSWTPPVAVQHLVGNDSVGRRYLAEIGLDPDSASEHLTRYLRQGESQTSRAPHRYQLAMVAALQARSQSGR
jgi:Phosphotransferase enzyme family